MSLSNGRNYWNFDDMESPFRRCVLALSTLALSRPPRRFKNQIDKVMNAPRTPQEERQTYITKNCAAEEGYCDPLVTQGI